MYFFRTSGNPELPERVMPAGVGDVVPVAHLDHPRVLDRRPVEALDARAEHRLVGDPLEVVAVLALGQAEVALVLRPRLGRPVQQQDLSRFPRRTTPPD